MIGVEAAIRIVELASVRLCGGNELSAAHPNGRKSAESEGQVHALRRAAWLPHAEDLPLAAIEALAAGLPDGVKLSAAGLAPGTVFTPGAARVLLNLLLLAADSLPRGGAVALAGSADDVFIRISGPNAAWPANFATLALDEAAALAALPTAAGLQPALTALLARQEGLRLSFVIPPTKQTMPPILRLSA